MPRLKPSRYLQLGQSNKGLTGMNELDFIQSLQGLLNCRQVHHICVLDKYTETKTRAWISSSFSITQVKESLGRRHLWFATSPAIPSFGHSPQAESPESGKTGHLPFRRWLMMNLKQIGWSETKKNIPASNARQEKFQRSKSDTIVDKEHHAKQLHVAIQIHTYSIHYIISCISCMNCNRRIFWTSVLKSGPNNMQL